MLSTQSTLKNYNFAKLFESENDSDVEFKIFNAVDTKTETKSVKGHQFLLGLLSPVLKKQFLYMKENVIEVRGPSFNSFRAFIKFLYSGEENDIKSINDLKVLFEIYGLGATYQVRGIRNLMNSFVEVPPTKLAYCLEVLQEYETNFIFEDLVKIVQEKCYETLNNNSSFDEIPPTDLIRIWESMNQDLVLWGWSSLKKLKDAAEKTAAAEKKEETERKEDSEEESWEPVPVKPQPKIIERGPICSNCNSIPCMDRQLLNKLKVGTLLRRTQYSSADCDVPEGTDAVVVGLNNEPQNHVRVDILVDDSKEYSFDYYPYFLFTYTCFQVGTVGIN